MSLKVKDIMEYMKDFAPLDLKESYDNVGLMVGDKEADIKGILVALDCTLEVIEEAKTKGVNLIITHHPLLFKKPSSITTDSLQGKKIIELIKNDINLYSSHTNLDSVSQGMNDTLVKLLGFDTLDIIDPNREYEGAGIGRMVSLKPSLTSEEVLNLIKERLSIEHLRFVGDKQKRINKIALINGAGQDYFWEALKKGADFIITGDTTYHPVSDFKEMGIAIADIGHFPSEWPIFKIISEKVKNFAQVKDKNIEFYVSERSKDPYEFI